MMMQSQFCCTLFLALEADTPSCNGHQGSSANSGVAEHGVATLKKKKYSRKSRKENIDAWVSGEIIQALEEFQLISFDDNSSPPSLSQQRPTEVKDQLQGTLFARPVKNLWLAGRKFQGQTLRIILEDIIFSAYLATIISKIKLGYAFVKNHFPQIADRFQNCADTLEAKFGNRTAVQCIGHSPQVYWWQYDFMDPDLDAVPDDNALDVRQALADLMAPRPQPATQARVSTPASPAQTAASPTPQETGPTEEHATEDVHSDRPSGAATATSTVAVSKSTRAKTRPIPKSTSRLGAAAGTTEDKSVVDDHVTVPKPTRKARRVPKSTADVGAPAEDDTETIQAVVARKPSHTKGVVKSTTEVGADAKGDNDTDTPEIQDGADVGAKTTRTPRRTTKATKPAVSPSKTARKGKGKKAQTEDTDDQPEEVPKRATRSQVVAEASSVATGSTRPPKRKAGEFIGVVLTKKAKVTQREAQREPSPVASTSWIPSQNDFQRLIVGYEENIILLAQMRRTQEVHLDQQDAHALQIRALERRVQDLEEALEAERRTKGKGKAKAKTGRK
ncbi:hypothetical protein DENSPDRAFT_855013 [Dentipellis sp. KUC8613]|nr:hypothetical protein DENSPDRAFT_855013 [Dentipellis sp. KUC8613]